MPPLRFRCVRCGLDFLVSRRSDTAGRDATCPIDSAPLARWDGPPTARPVTRSPRGVPTPLVVGVGGPAGSGKSTLIEALCRRVAMPDLLLIERAGTSATATFSHDLVDATIGVLDLAAAAREDVAAARWHLLVVSKIDRAPAASSLGVSSVRCAPGGGAAPSSSPTSRPSAGSTPSWAGSSATCCSGCEPPGGGSVNLTCDSTCC